MIKYDAKVPGLKDRVLLNQAGMTNCLGYAQLVDQCHRIVFDSAKDNAFYLHMKEGEKPIRIPRNKMNIYALPLGKDFLRKFTKGIIQEKWQM